MPDRLVKMTIMELIAEVKRLEAANRARDELAAECAARCDVDVRERLAEARAEGMEAAAKEQAECNG